MQLELLHQPAVEQKHSSPILFVHGAWADAHNWDHVLPYFAERGYECYALSLRNHGQSKTHNRWTTRLAHYVEDIEHVAQQFNEPPILIGHSLGTLLIQHYLQNHPAKAVVLLAPVPPRGMMKNSAQLASKHVASFSRYVLKTGWHSSMRDYNNQLELAPEDYPKDFTSIWDEPPLVYWDMLRGFSTKKIIKQTVPMLLLAGERDHLLSPHMLKIMQQTYQADTKLYPKLGHNLMRSNAWPEIVNTIQEWLETL